MRIASTEALRSGRRIDPGFVGLLAALVVLPLYPKVGLIEVRGTYIPIRIDDFVTLAVLMGWGVTLFLERRRPRLPPIASALIAWLALGALALVVGAALLGTISWTTGLLFWAKPMEYLALGWVAYDLVDRPSRLRLVLAAVFAAATVVVAYALLERFGWVPHAPNYATDVSVLRALGSTMGDSHQLATYAGVAALLAVALWHRAGSAVRIFALVGLGLTAYVLAHAAGRSEFLSLAVCVVVLAVWRPARVPALAMLAMLVVSFALPLGVEQTLDTALRPGGSAAQQSPSPSTEPGVVPPSGAPADVQPSPNPVTVSERFDQLGSDVSLQIRLQERWPVFIKIAMRDPLFGAGPSAATEAADGYYIRSFTEVGIVGTLAFGALILSVVLALRRVARSASDDARALAIGLLAGTAFVAVVGILIDTWVASRPMQLYWPAVGAALATLAAQGWQATAVRDRSTPDAVVGATPG